LISVRVITPTTMFDGRLIHTFGSSDEIENYSFVQILKEMIGE
jgi:hypothetical protein